MTELLYYVNLLLSYFTLPYFLCMILLSIPIVWGLVNTSIERKGMIWLLCIYLISLFYFSTLTRGNMNGSLLRLHPFWSYVTAYQTKDWYLLVQNILNILLFIPIGALLHSFVVSRRKAFYLGFIYCFLIEISQLILRKGYFDVDDIIHNGFGIILGILIWTWVRKKSENFNYVVSKYEFCKNDQTIRIAMLSDLHEFNVIKYIKELERLKPDIILLVGDVLERREGHKHQKKEEYKGNWFLYRLAWFIDDVLEFFFGEQDRTSLYSKQFLIEARKIAPVYYSRGNHERDMLIEDYHFFKKHDIVFLDNEDVKLDVKGRIIRIGGLSTVVNEMWLESFSKKDGEKILMMHHPEYYEQYLTFDNFDLILSGHAHGGQIRIFNQGIFSPGQGLFPKYTKGLYEKNFIVSTGCSNTSYIPRIGNPREIVEIDF